MPGGIMEGLITPSLAEIMEGLAVASLGEDDLRAVRDRAVLLGQEDDILQVVQDDDVEEEEEEEEEESSDCDSACEISDCRNMTGIKEDEEKLKKNSFGVLDYGCIHYRRRCQIRAPCCGEVYDCRHCHNEVKNANEPIPEKRHDLPRHLVEFVICSICSTEQEVQQICKNCGVCMGEYFCVKCKFFDDDVKKGQYHCDGCGICRVGGSDKFFHCKRCGCCYSKVLQSGHPCVEKSMHQNCPVCFEYLFDSIKDISVMLCGHTMHKECWDEMRKHSQYTCPMCSKSIVDMTECWKQLDQEIAATPMPEAYQNKMVWILCNDCGVTSKVSFHIIAHKCANCSSYNTRQTAGRPEQEHPGTSVDIRL